MACSNCGDSGHNVQTCPSVRRCRQCGRRGHDRRNCPDARAQPPAPAPREAAEACSLEELRALCSDQRDLLIHLYWPERQRYFGPAHEGFLAGHGWRFLATPGHGVRHGAQKPTRSTLNLLVGDTTFADAYEQAASARSLHHGVVLRRSVLSAKYTAQLGYELVNVRVGHPLGHGCDNPEEYWRFDIGNHRFASLESLSTAAVVRLATPPHSAEICVPTAGVVAWW